jgi:hypothetical protein
VQAERRFLNAMTTLIVTVCGEVFSAWLLWMAGCFENL